MRWNGRRFAAVLGVFLAVAVASCERAVAPETDPSITAPLSTLDALSPVVEGQDGEEYTLLQGPVETVSSRDLTVSQWIDLRGGSLHLMGHDLVVPGGAVLRPTLFSMTVVNRGYVEVELRATIIRKLLRFLGRVVDSIIDVGELGFNRPVTLELSYANAASDVEASRLVIVRLRDDGTVEAVPTEVDSERKVVRAQLDHFSRYCIASN